MPLWKKMYEKCYEYNRLSDIKFLFITEACRMLDVDTSLKWSMDFNVSGNRSQRLLSMCLEAGAN